MSKEIYISTTPHETRLAIVEDEQLAEIYYERENEYTLAGSIYNGKVTRVLPGMQSSFVDIGLERDAFLYVTDFMEEQGDAADFDSEGGGRRSSRGEGQRAEGQRSEGQRAESPREEGSRGARDRGRRNRRDAAEPVRETTSFDEPIAPAPVSDDASGYDNQAALDEQGSRRWRGRRGRRRGRGGRDEASFSDAHHTTEGTGSAGFDDSETIVLEGSSDDDSFGQRGLGADGAISIDLEASEAAGEPENLGRRNVHRPGRMGRPGSEERAARQMQPEVREDRRRDSGRGRGDRRPSESREREDDFLPVGAVVTTLPGESIRKYRDPAEVAADDAARKAAEPAAPEPLVSSRASFEVVGWDGGTTLPGETISRYNRASRESGREQRRSKRGGDGLTGRMGDPGEALAAEVATPSDTSSAEPLDGTLPHVSAQQENTSRLTPEAVASADASPIASEQDEIASSVAPDETGGLTAHPAHAIASAAAEAVEVKPQEIVAEAGRHTPVSDAGEYEPAEGDRASLREQDRRDLRRRERVSPTVEVARDGDAEASALPAPSNEPVDRTHAETIVETSRADKPADGELSIFGAGGVPTPGHSAESVEPTQSEIAAPLDAGSPQLNKEQEKSAAFLPAASAMAPDQGLASPSDPSQSDHEYTSLQPDGSMLTEPETGSAAEEEIAADDQAIARDLRPNEELSGADSELAAAEPIGQVHAYGEGDFSEEELDGDEYEYEVAVSAIDEDDFDDYEEETLHGDTEAESEGFASEPRFLTDEENDDELEAESDAGGFTVDDFGGEPSGEEEPAGTGNAPSSPGERRGRRDGRRGGRDRDRGQRGERPFRGGAGADRGRGRSRQSVQTMDLPAITDLLKPGQEVLVQIAKEPIAKKGARITSHIALPGRFLVFMPTVNHTGVSRKISSDEERRRLKSILLSEKGEHQGGFIVRTAADGATEEELRNDLRFLIQLWQDIKMRSESSKSPALIYHDLGLIERILRDQVTDTFSAIWVDSEQEYERVLRFLQRFQPSLVRRVKLYIKETPLFEHFGITTEIDKALKSKVWLKSGGSIVINQTEALVAIDINTGKYVGKTARLEDTILKTNLDAIPEIVRQIRLRDLGGIIVIDFIDMDERKNRAKVMQALEDELKTDRAPSKVLPFNDFGLVIMTRKRVKQSLERTLCVPDPVTEGTGMIKSPVTVANEIYVETRKMYRHVEKPDLLLRVHPEVVKQLKSGGARRLQELEEMTHKTILLKSDPSLSPEKFDIQ